MSEKIKSFFDQKMTTSNKNDQQAIELATTALLVEMIHMDDDVSDTERGAVFLTIKNQFELNEEQTQELYDLAESELKQTTDYSQFTQLINQHFSNDEKLTIIKLLWRIAYSDNQLHRDEAYFVQKISNLLEVSQEDFDLCRDKIRKEIL